MVMTRPLRDEHRGLTTGIDALRTTAEAVEYADGKALTLLDESVDFLLNHLIPHAQAEDAVLYPKVEQVMRAPGATATMSRDHEEVASLTRELVTLRDRLTRPPTRDQRRALQRALYGLYAIVRLHFAKEEEIYLPVLDAGMTEEQAARLFTEMDEEARKLSRE